MFRALDVSASALVAQRARLDTIAGNLANLNTTRNERGEIAPYRRRFVVFAPAGEDGAAGVQVAGVFEDDAPPVLRFEPGHPEANADGYVAYPNIDQVTEFVNALEATRAYEANVGVIGLTKSMATHALRILA